MPTEDNAIYKRRNPVDTLSSPTCKPEWNHQEKASPGDAGAFTQTDPCIFLSTVISLDLCALPRHQKSHRTEEMGSALCILLW